jgi:hypothetical protein
VTKAELAFEIQFAHDGTMPGLDKFDVHVRCFAAWEFDGAHVLTVGPDRFWCE